SALNCDAASTVGSAGSTRALFVHSLWIFKFQCIWRQGRHIAAPHSFLPPGARASRSHFDSRQRRCHLLGSNAGETPALPGGREEWGGAHDVEDCGARICVWQAISPTGERASELWWAAGWWIFAYGSARASPRSSI